MEDSGPIGRLPDKCFWSIALVRFRRVTGHGGLPGQVFGLLLRWWSGLVFTRGRHDALQSQIGHHVPVVLIGMRRIDGEQRQFGQVEVEEFHHLAAFCIGHAVECLVAVGDSVLERGHQVGL